MAKPPPGICQISARDTYTLRHSVLSPTRPVKECHFESDGLNTTLHLGAFIGKKLVGVVSYMKEPTPLFNDPVQYRLRGMAVLPQARHQKIGEHLLLEGESRLQEKNRPLLIWFNARISAVGFYKHYNYLTKGEVFKITNACTQSAMYKRL